MSRPRASGGKKAAAESLVDKKARARTILKQLDRAYPGATIALHFGNPLELLVATILSAQCTDERVNAVTVSLFQRYRSANDYAEAAPATLEGEIHATGFFKAKTRSLIGMGQALVARHGGEVPKTVEELTALPGVGRKTASVVLGNAFGIPAIAVDTHVFRVSQRLELARADDPDQVQDQLAEVIARPQWTHATHLFIIHGRRTCQARTPACPECAVEASCPWPEKTGSAPRK